MKMKIGKKKIGYSKFEKMDFPFIYLLIAFPVLQFIVFWIYVNASSIALSFQTSQGEWTLKNIEAVFKAFDGIDTYGLNFGESLKHSITLWLVSHLICFPISIITTYVLQRQIWGHYVWRVCYIVPSLMGAIIWTTLVKYMVAFDGPIVELLIKAGVEFPEMTLRNGLLAAEETAFPTLVSVMVVMGLVGNNAVLTGAFSRIPDEIFESAKIDGAGFWRECFQIAIPCVWSTLVMMMTFSLCSVFTADSNVFLYSNGTGEPGMSTVGFHLYFITYRISMMGGGRATYGYPAALGLVLTCMTLPIVLIGRWALEKLQEAVEL